MNKQIKKTKSLLKVWSAIALFCIINSANVFAQVTWEKTYFNLQTFGQKGDNTDDSGFVSTGRTKVEECMPEQAYILETDAMGNTVWNTAIGDINYFFHGISVKQTSLGGYVVVGATTKGQIYEGVRSGRFCENLDPYYNSFIAYVDPNNSAQNWYLVIGDSMANDYALDVVEDSLGNFVFTGASNGKLPCSSECEENDSLWCTGSCSPTFDLLLVKVSNNGVLLTMTRQNYPGIDYLIGTSITYSAFNGQYAIAGVCDYNSRDIAALTFDNAFNFVNAQRFGINDNINQEAKSIIETNNHDYVITGHHGKNQSFVIRTDVNLNKLGGSVLNIPNNYTIQLEDAVESTLDTQIFVVSGTARNATQLNTEMCALKLYWDGVGFVPLNLNGAGNIALYGYDKDQNANLVKNVYWEWVIHPIVGFQKEEYHLFGNTQYTDSKKSEAYYVNTDNLLGTGCNEYDSVAYEYDPYSAEQVSLRAYNIDIRAYFDLISLPFADSVFCDLSYSELQKRTNGQMVSDQPVSALTVYPNPADKEFTLQLNSLTAMKNAKMDLFNQNGVKVHSLAGINLAKGNNSLKIVSDKLKSGIYFGVITNGNDRNTFKVVISR